MLIASPNIPTSFDSFTKTLAAVEMTPVGMTAEFVLFTESDFPFEINIPGVTGGFVKGQLGLEYRCSPGYAFTEIQLRNPAGTTTTQTVEGYFGFGRIEDRRLNIVGTRPNQMVRFTEAPSTDVTNSTTGGGGGLASNNLTGLYSGAATGAHGRRKFAIITNEDASNDIWIVNNGASNNFASAQANKLAVVKPGTDRRIDTDADFYVFNPNGVAVHFTASFWWFTNLYA